MSFLKKFADNLKNNNNDTKPPAGVNLQFSSFNKGGPSAQGFNLPPKPNEKSGGFEVQPHKVGKPGGGWEDEDGEQAQFSLSKSNTGGNKFSLGGDNKYNMSAAGGDKKNPKYDDSIKTSNSLQFSKEFELLSIEDLMTRNIEYELKLVMDIVQPAGARIKPPDSSLLEFGKASMNMPVQLISSILITNIQDDNIWVVKAKSFYVIEYLCKNFPGYQKYFKHHILKLKSMPIPTEGNNSQLINIKDGIIKFIENPQGQGEKAESSATQQSSQENKVNLLDLGGDTTSKPPEQEKKKNAFEFIHGKKKAAEPVNNSGNVELLGNEPVVNTTDNNLISISIAPKVETTEPVSQNPASKFKFINKSNQNTESTQNQAGASTAQQNPTATQHQKMDAFKMFSGKDEKKKAESQPVNVGSDLMSLNFSDPALNQPNIQSKSEAPKQQPTATAKPAVNPNLMNLYPQQQPPMYNPAMGYNPMYNPGYPPAYGNQFIPGQGPQMGGYPAHPSQMGYQNNMGYPNPMMYQNMGAYQGYQNPNMSMGGQGQVPGMYNPTSDLNNMSMKRNNSGETSSSQSKGVPNEKEKAFDFIKLE